MTLHPLADEPELPTPSDPLAGRPTLEFLAELRHTAAAHGVRPPTSRQLHRWRRQGLIDPPGVPGWDHRHARRALELCAAVDGGASVVDLCRRYR